MSMLPDSNTSSFVKKIMTKGLIFVFDPVLSIKSVIQFCFGKVIS